MNKEQREAINDAIGVEEDWLYRAEIEAKRTGKPIEGDPSVQYHRRKLAALKEGM